MDLRLDRASGVSLGTQLEARLRAAIADGGVGPGGRLPSLRQVAAEAGVNVNTVRAVYARLEAAGAIVTEQGRGTFVAPAGTGWPRPEDGKSAVGPEAYGPSRADIGHGRQGSARAPEADPAASPPGAHPTPSPADVRRALREQIARLEAELARMPAPRPLAETAQPPAYPGLLTTAELAAIRDALLDRLSELDAARAEVVRRLATLDEPTTAPAPRRSSSTLSGARVRWVGA